MILATYEQLQSNKKKTAETLRINLRTLYNRLKQYQVNGASDPSGDFE
jgi:DNA-binding NtrC family response regulator